MAWLQTYMMRSRNFGASSESNSIGANNRTRKGSWIVFIRRVNRRKFSLKKSFIAVAVAAAAFATAQVDVNRTVVVINGEEIKGAEYYHRMEFLSGVGKPMSRGVAEFPPGFLTIEQLITERLIFQLAKNKGVYPTEPEVNNELSLRLQDNPKLQEEWINSGRTQEDLRYMIRLELAQFKVSTAGINVTDQEVDAHFKANPNMYSTPKKMKISVILVSDAAAAQKVDAELKAGKAFAEVAKMHSEDVTKSIGGEMGEIATFALSEAVRLALEKTKIGFTTEWLSTGDRKVKFLLQNVIPAKRIEMTPKLRRDIRKRLMLDKGRVKNDITKEMIDLRAKANIDIKDKVFAEAYAKFMEAYKKDISLKGSGG
jgi:parvulin-like peptidyl-prolyl isomerase